MASSGIQLLGFLLSLVGISATVAATFMVEWKKQMEGENYRIYEGLWMTCSGEERTTCQYHESLLELPSEIQITRSIMMLSIFLSSMALMIGTVGMKCTRFMDDKARSKSTIAMVGGIMITISGLLAIIITSWYVKMIVDTLHTSHHLQRFEFGKAVFVSLAGGLLMMAGGTFLSCRRCSRSELPVSNLHTDHFMPTTHSKSNYV
ncbi:claudin-1-like [Solea senegalensis]|uniref:Claudin-1-like n=2 Tax=Solea senegalensis TaxID=28829 RepID=A0AAV6SCR0_SOLSE|nr:claudin-7 isoform X1 [Solea senegalensis]KAG7514665.1 claudin-1-like [Solea senegalensis]